MIIVFDIQYYLLDFGILFYVFKDIIFIYYLCEFRCSLLIYIYLAVSTCGIYNMLLVNGNEAEIFNSQNISGI